MPLSPPVMSAILPSSLPMYFSLLVIGSLFFASVRASERSRPVSSSCFLSWDAGSRASSSSVVSILEGSGRILHEGDVVAKLHTKARGALDAGVRDHADEDELLDPPLGEVGVEIGIGEAALCPVLQHDDVTIAWAECGMELSAPTSGSEALGLVRPHLGWV